MHITQRGSPTDWEQLILESWRVWRRTEKSGDHASVWKKDQVWANILVCHGKHPCMASGLTVLYKMPQRKAVMDKLTKILNYWKTEYVEKKPKGDQYTQDNTVPHGICQSQKQWKTGHCNKPGETNSEGNWRFWTFWVGCPLIHPPLHMAILWKAPRSSVISTYSYIVLADKWTLFYLIAGGKN